MCHREITKRRPHISRINERWLGCSEQRRRKARGSSASPLRWKRQNKKIKSIIDKAAGQDAHGSSFGVVPLNGRSLWCLRWLTIGFILSLCSGRQWVAVSRCCCCFTDPPSWFSPSPYLSLSLPLSLFLTLSLFLSLPLTHSHPVSPSAPRCSFVVLYRARWERREKGKGGKSARSSGCCVICASAREDKAECIGATERRETAHCWRQCVPREWEGAKVKDVTVIGFDLQ